MKKNDRGSVLLEFIIVMPVLLLLIFGTVQFALILMAKQLTQYAAFNAARAAIVYNPKDYRVPNATEGKGFSQTAVLSIRRPSRRWPFSVSAAARRPIKLKFPAGGRSPVPLT